MILPPSYCQPFDQLDYSISHNMPYAHNPENIENLDFMDFRIFGIGKISINELQTTYKKFHGC